MKICSLYGAGFYYIPGTDTCIKVGGFVRVQTQYNVNANSTNGAMGATTTNAANRTTQDYTTRNRGYITADARSQTEYGTLRSYIAVGVSGDNATAGGSSAASQTFNANRAFIQLGGWTAGRTISFFETAGTAALAYAAGGGNNFAGGQTTGDGGWQVLGYTAQLGNGLSASVAVEDSRQGQVLRYTGAGVGSANAIGVKTPDFVANIRVDQSWGSAAIVGALHDASATYYAADLAAHPGNVMGYAIGGGLKVNLPMLGKGDYIDAMVNYSVGASRYTSAGNNEGLTSGANITTAVNTDAVFSTVAGSNLELTKQLSIFAGYEHNWNSQLKTSLWGDYGRTTYSAAASALIGAGVAGYDANWSMWQVGSRTAWAPVTNLEVGLEVFYTKLNAPATQNVLTNKDQSAWAGQLRIQRNFYP